MFEEDENKEKEAWAGTYKEKVKWKFVIGKRSTNALPKDRYVDGNKRKKKKDSFVQSLNWQINYLQIPTKIARDITNFETKNIAINRLTQKVR